MKPMQKALFTLALLTLYSLAAFAQQPAQQADKLKRIEQAIQAEMQKNGVPGIAVAIAQRGQVVYAKGFGYADAENKVPFNPQTVSRIGSISKTFTALAVMQLVEQGKVKLDDEVQAYVPSFPRKSAPVTIRQLLGHQGGIRHYKSNEMMSARHYNTVEESLTIFKDDPLIAEPGTKYSYTTYGFNLLSRVVEAASGMSFGDYLQQRVFNPLGLKETYLDDPPKLIPNRARNYTKLQNGPLENAPAVDQSNKWGGGGIVSTVEDLLRYAASYDTAQLLRTATIAQMFTAQTTRDGKPTNYGFGWATALEDGRRRVEHNGGSIGATSALSKYPEQQTTIVVLVNNNFFTAPRFRALVSKIWFE
jgi:serine beta-lactamase-like protein LACTB